MKSRDKSAATAAGDRLAWFREARFGMFIHNDRLSDHKVPTFYGDYATPEVSVPNRPVSLGGKVYDWETCMTMNSHWGFCAEDKSFKSSRTILEALARCVSMDGNLLLNVGPDALGRLPGESVTILKELAAWMSANAASVHGCGRSPHTPPCGLTYTRKGNELYLHLFGPPMGDVILPELKGRIEKITGLADGVDVPMITHWGSELLAADEIRIRPPPSLPPMSVLKISLKDY